MVGAPRLEIAVLGEHGFHELIQHVLGRLADERGVREQRLVVLPIQARDVANEVLLRRARFDGWHGLLLVSQMDVRFRRATRVGTETGNCAPRVISSAAGGLAERAGATPSGVRAGAAKRPWRGGRSCPLCGLSARRVGGTKRRPLFVRGRRRFVARSRAAPTRWRGASLRAAEKTKRNGAAIASWIRGGPSLP